MKTILAPIDFSANSLNSAEAAADIARRTKSKLHLLNVVLRSDYFMAAEPMFYALPAQYLLDDSDKKIMDTAAKNLSKVASRKMFSGLAVKCKVRTSKVIHDEIIRYSNEVKADLIVIGSKGASGLKDILLGSTAERVVRFSERPVFVVPSRFKSSGLSPIVFASDFLDEAYSIFPFVRNFAKIMKAEIHLLKINTVDQFNSTHDNFKLMSDFNKFFKSKFKMNIYDDFMKEEGILNYSRQVNGGMIALGTHGKKGLMRFFRADISGGMVRLSQKPILVVNIRKFKLKVDLK